MKCKLCGKETEYIEKHHIIPKSRGGSDDINNLIELCSKCHGLAHDVSFTNNRVGLIKESLNKKISKHKIDVKWLEKNEKLVLNKMMNLYNNDEDMHMLMLLLIEKRKFNASHIRKWFEIGTVTFKTSITF